MSVRLNSVWMVPNRDSEFVGRSVELKALEQAFQSSKNSALTQAAGIHGLGGVGKTLLAIEFAYQNAGNYDNVFWLAAENNTTLASSFASLAGILELPEVIDPDQNARVAAVGRWLETNRRWLLVFDNAECREDIKPYIPSRHKGHILITSRNPDWAPLAKAIKIPMLPRADSIALLKRGLRSRDSDDGANRLAEALGDLPIALAQAAALIREYSLSFAEYLGLFQVKLKEFDGDNRNEPSQALTVAVTLSLSFDRLKKGHEGVCPAEILLARCAFFAPDRIPRDLLQAEPPRNLPAIEAPDELRLNESRLNDAIKTLKSFSLVEPGDGHISVHRLVQRAVRDLMDTENRERYAADSFLSLYSIFPTDPYDIDKWSEIVRLLDHALQVADHAIADQGNDIIFSICHLIGGLYNVIGGYFLLVHNYSRAKELFYKAMKASESSLGPDHIESVRPLANLGQVAVSQGDFEGARQCLEQAHRVFESTYGPDHPDVARILGNLGIVARHQGKLGQARTNLRRAVRTAEKSIGPNSLDVARYLTNLGSVVLDQGKPKEARRFIMRAMTIFEKSFEVSENPELAINLTILASVAKSEGNLEEAQLHLVRSLEIFKSFFGANHSLYITTSEDLNLVAKLIAKKTAEANKLSTPPHSHSAEVTVMDQALPLSVVPTAGILTALDHEFVAKKAMLDQPKDCIDPNRFRRQTTTSPSAVAECPPRVYISYTWRTKGLKRRALGLAEKLRKAGVDARIDFFYGKSRHGFRPPDALPGRDAWEAWQEEQIRDADCVLVICTQEYCESQPSSGAWRDMHFMQKKLEAGRAKPRDFIPVGYGPHAEISQFIPEFIKGAHYYDLSASSAVGYGFEDLVRRLKTEFAHPNDVILNTEDSSPPSTERAPSMTQSKSQRSLVWLHLSDLHFCRDRTGWDAHRVLRPLVADLKRMEADHGLTPQLLFFTGDAAFGNIGQIAGSTLLEQFDGAQSVLEAARTAFSNEILRENVFIVPGNHDVDRDEITDDQTDWLARQTDPTVVNDLIRKAKRQWQNHFARLAAYRDFLTRYNYEHLLADPTRLIFSQVRELEGLKLGIAGFNSSWSCGAHDSKGHLWFAGDWQSGELLSQLTDTEVQIALTHHPFGWFVESEDTPLRILFEREFAFHLHGHEHLGWVDAKADGHIRVAAAACYDRSDRENGYNLVRLDLNTGEGEVWLRRYDRYGGGWVPRVIAGKTNNDGKWHLGLLSRLRGVVPTQNAERLPEANTGSMRSTAYTNPR